MDSKRKIWIQRMVSLLCAAGFLLFGSSLGDSRFCLGDRMFALLGIPAWSKGTQGLHYPGIIALVGVMGSFCFFSRTAKDPKKTTAYLIVGSIAVLYLANFLLNLR